MVWRRVTNDGRFFGGDRVFEELVDHRSARGGYDEVLVFGGRPNHDEEAMVIGLSVRRIADPNADDPVENIIDDGGGLDLSPAEARYVASMLSRAADAVDPGRASVLSDDQRDWDATPWPYNEPTSDV